MKTCSRCGAEKPTAEFGKRKAAHDGLHPYCKQCVSVYTKEGYRRDREKIIARNKAYRNSNPDQVRATKRKNYERNRDRVAEKNAVYYAENRERLLERRRQYLADNAETRKKYEQDNRHVFAAKAARRRARIAAQTIPLTPADEAKIKAIYGFAKYLTNKFGRPYHVDHIKPLKGKTSSGLHVPWNLQILPASQNLSKSNREDW